MFDIEYDNLDGAQQLQLLEVVANVTFRMMVNNHVEELQQRILDINAEGTSPEDFRVEYATAQREYQTVLNLKEFLEYVSNDLETKAR